MRKCEQILNSYGKIFIEIDRTQIMFICFFDKILPYVQYQKLPIDSSEPY